MEQGHYEAVALLLQAGADVHASTVLQRTSKPFWVRRQLRGPQQQSLLHALVCSNSSEGSGASSASPTPFQIQHLRHLETWCLLLKVGSYSL